MFARSRRLLPAAVMTTALAIVPVSASAKGPSDTSTTKKTAQKPAGTGIGRKAH